MSALSQFKEGKRGEILVATDVAARGLDIDDIDTVIQLACRHVDSFVHRCGRTGRAGKNGTNIVFSQKSDLELLRTCEKNLKISIRYTNDIGVDDNDKRKEEQNAQNEKLVRQIKSTASKQLETQDQHVDEIIKFYEESDESARKNMFQNVLAALML